MNYRQHRQGSLALLEQQPGSVVQFEFYLLVPNGHFCAALLCQFLVVVWLNQSFSNLLEQFTYTLFIHSEKIRVLALKL